MLFSVYSMNTFAIARVRSIQAVSPTKHRHRQHEHLDEKIKTCCFVACAVFGCVALWCAYANNIIRSVSRVSVLRVSRAKLPTLLTVLVVARRASLSVLILRGCNNVSQGRELICTPDNPANRRRHTSKRRNCARVHDCFITYLQLHTHNTLCTAQTANQHKQQSHTSTHTNR